MEPMQLVTIVVCVVICIEKTDIRIVIIQTLISLLQIHESLIIFYVPPLPSSVANFKFSFTIENSCCD